MLCYVYILGDCDEYRQVLHANGCLQVIFQFLQSTLQLLQRNDSRLNTLPSSTSSVSGTSSLSMVGVSAPTLSTVASSSLLSSSSSSSSSGAAAAAVVVAVGHGLSDIHHYCHTALQTAAWAISNLARGEIPGSLFVNSGRSSINNLVSVIDDCE